MNKEKDIPAEIQDPKARVIIDVVTAYYSGNRLPKTAKLAPVEQREIYSRKRNRRPHSAAQFISFFLNASGYSPITIGEYINRTPDEVQTYIKLQQGKMRRQKSVREDSIALSGALDEFLYETEETHQVSLLQTTLSCLNPEIAVRNLAQVILDVVSQTYSVNKLQPYLPQDLVGRSRIQEQVEPRNIAIYILETYGIGQRMIGRILGNRNHKTIIHNSEQIKKCLRQNQELADLVSQIEDEVRTIVTKEAKTDI